MSMRKLTLLLTALVLVLIAGTAGGSRDGTGSAVSAASLECGGFAGIPCPGNLQCYDDRSDDCFPELGGADCPGVCRNPNSGTECGATLCNQGETCCSGQPFRVPTCVKAPICPV